MSDLKKSFFAGRQAATEAARQQREQTRLEQENRRKTHLHWLSEANKLIAVFNNNTGLFRKNRLFYCLDHFMPDTIPRVTVFRTGLLPTSNPERIHIAVGCSGQKAFALETFTRTEMTDWDARTRHFEYYYGYTNLSDDADGAAHEFIRLLGLGEVKFERLWKPDSETEGAGTRDIMKTCPYKYFIRQMGLWVMVFGAMVAVIWYWPK